MVTSGELPATRRITLEQASGVFTITLADEDNRNALGAELVTELLAALAAGNDDPDTRVMVLTNRGSTFCAGANLREQSGGATTSPQSAPFEDLLQAIIDAPKPVVGRIDGHVVGGGMGLAAALDICLARDDVSFGFSEVRLGVVPAIISVVCLPRMRVADAREAFLRGHRFPAGEAAAMGLINRAVPASQLDAAVEEVVGDILKGGPEALATAKMLLRTIPGMHRDEAFAWSGELSRELFRSAEAAEGMQAFLDKRPPSWHPKSGH